MNPAGGLTGAPSGGGGTKETTTGLKRTGSLHSTASISSLHASKSSSMESLESSMSTNDCPPGKGEKMGEGLFFLVMFYV